jgi:hypothetical protein
MTSTRAIAALFLVAALYDGLLGAVFLVAPGWVYEQAQVTPPNHWAYVQFPAALLMVFACMFVAIGINPIANRNLIPYGILLKVSYCGLAFWYWSIAGVPGLWKPFAVIDLIMAVLFALAFRKIDKRGRGVELGEPGAESR